MASNIEVIIVSHYHRDERELTTRCFSTDNVKEAEKSFLEYVTSMDGKVVEEEYEDIFADGYFDTPDETVQIEWVYITEAK
jgi:hypothetical protein